MSTPFDDYDYIDQMGLDDEDDDGLYADCGLDRDGQCSKAGSEECDFECPHRNTPAYAGYVAPRRDRRGSSKTIPMKGEVAALPPSQPQHSSKRRRPR